MDESVQYARHRKYVGLTCIVTSRRTLGNIFLSKISFTIFGNLRDMSKPNSPHIYYVEIYFYVKHQ